MKVSKPAVPLYLYAAMLDWGFGTVSRPTTRCPRYEFGPRHSPPSGSTIRQYRPGIRAPTSPTPSPAATTRGLPTPTSGAECWMPAQIGTDFTGNGGHAGERRRPFPGPAARSGRIEGSPRSGAPNFRGRDAVMSLPAAQRRGLLGAWVAQCGSFLCDEGSWGAPRPIAAIPAAAPPSPAAAPREWHSCPEQLRARCHCGRCLRLAMPAEPTA
jgi:hypothetical protein